jgi:cell division protease FtsH
MQDIDNEVKRIVDEQLQRARRILEENRDLVETVTAALLERETIDAEEFKLLMQGLALPEMVVNVDHSTGPEATAVETPDEDQPADPAPAPAAGLEDPA